MININPFQESKNAISYLAINHKRTIATLSLLFVIGILIGISIDLDTKQQSFENLRNSDLAQKFDSYNELELSLHIMVHNNLIAIAIILSGIILALFGVFQIAGLGLLVGMLGSYTYQLSPNIIKIIMTVLPHGLIEIPAILITATYAIDIFSTAVKERNLKATKEAYIRAIKAYFFLILPMLVLAAIIEGFVTLYIVGLL